MVRLAYIYRYFPSAHIRQKKQRNFIERIKKQGWDIVAKATKNKNGMLYTDYAMDIDAAKFFVAKYDNEVGDAYVIFLIKCSKIVENLEKEMCPEEYLLRQAQLMLEHKKRLDKVEKQTQQVEDRVQAIEERQEAAQNVWADFPVPDGELPYKTYRKLFNEIIRTYCKVNGIEEYGSLYHKIYAEFNYRFDLNLKTRAKNRNMAVLDYAEKQGYMEDLYHVAYDYCSPPKIDAKVKNANMYLLKNHKDKD